MQEPVPKRIIQSADQPVQDLHTGAKDSLRKLGHPVTQQSIDPHDQTPLENIKEALRDISKDQVRVVGGTIEEHMSGESHSTHVGTTGGKEPISIWLKKKILRRAA